MRSRITLRGQMLNAAVALALTLVGSASNASAQRRLQDKSEPLTITSTVSAITAIGSSVLTEASRLLEATRTGSFAAWRHSNAG